MKLLLVSLLIIFIGQIPAETVEKSRKLPLGITNIREILEGGYIYVDKTGLIFDLMLEHKYDFFMVRPKGFGKTLFLSTLEEIFNGSQKLFEGTAIHRSKYNWLTYPVLRFDFSRMNCHDPSKFETALRKELKKMAKAHGIAPVDGEDLKVQMTRFVEDLSKKRGIRVVILVDEYDAPITKTMTDLKTAEKCRNIIINFVTIVTGLSNEFLQFTFVTGVNGFSICGPQGCADDQLFDVTYDPKFATLMGFTKEELETNFADYLSMNGSQTLGINIIDETRMQYNGYRFTDKEVSVYNPLSILNHLSAQHVENQSYHEKIPSFLIDAVRNNPEIIFDLKNSATAGYPLESHIDISRRINLEPYLFQMGYLTVRGHRIRDTVNQYSLDFRNEDAKNTFFRTLLEGLTEVDPAVITRGNEMKQNLAELDVNSFVSELYTHISRIPMALRQIATLLYYRAIFYLLLENVGLEVKVEVDYTRTEISDIVYLFKFSYNQTGQFTLEQLVSKMPKNLNKKTVCVGINFNERHCNINDWKAALYDGERVVNVYPSYSQFSKQDIGVLSNTTNSSTQSRKRRHI